MRAWTLLVLAAVAALTITLGPRPPRASGGAFACDIHDVFYDVTGVRLTERIPAIWSYTGDTGDATAQVTTTQTGTLDWHQAHSTKAQRAKYRQMATFEELTGACRVGDWRQGTIRAKAQGMDYAVSGTWNAGGQSGSCGGGQTTTRALSGQFDRVTLATAPPSRRIRIKIDLGPPRLLDCPFDAVTRVQDDGSGGGDLVAAHLRRARVTYEPYVVTVPKTKIVGHRTVRIPFEAKGAAGVSWGEGHATATPTASGTITLRVYKDCHIRTMDDLLDGDCAHP